MSYIKWYDSLYNFKGISMIKKHVLQWLSEYNFHWVTKLFLNTPSKPVIDNKPPLVYISSMIDLPQAPRDGVIYAIKSGKYFHLMIGVLDTSTGKTYYCDFKKENYSPEPVDYNITYEDVDIGIGRNVTLQHIKTSAGMVTMPVGGVTLKPYTDVTTFYVE